MLRRLSSLGLMLALALTLAALPARAQNREVQKTVDLQSGGSLTLDTFKGSIRLTTWDQNKVEIVARIEADLESDDINREYAVKDISREYAERSVEVTRVVISGSGRSVRIRSDYDDVPCREYRDSSSWGNTCIRKVLPYVHYTIRAPRSLRLTIDDHKSEITLEGFEGSLHLDTHRGPIKLANISGDIRLETHRSEVTLTDLGGDIRIETHRGEIEARNLKGDFRLSTHRGKLDLAGFSGSVEIETYRGEIKLDRVHLDSNSRIETSRGRITMSVAENQALSIRGTVGRRGDFETDFEMSIRSLGRDRFEAEINGGGPLLYVSTDSGKIRLRRQ